ncbi:hypothetical protein [Mucilaginibacter sp.]
MIEKNKAKLHALIFEISKLSTDIDEMKKKRDVLLSRFKKIQLVKNNVESASK